MPDKDIRWQQRFSNYKKALAQLQKFIDKGALNELEEQGLIKSFEYTYELAWNTIKDFYEGQGETGIQGSRDAFRIAINRRLVQDGDTWMQMIESRIKTSHTYDEEVADEIASDILNAYHPLFIQLQTRLNVEQQTS
jgi:nucleotidyltransferase substrate binding protein (TIGR01987 family)